MKEDLEIAKQVRENAYAPYSNYKVGAALRSKNGKIYTGVNIENDGIMSICAERSAFIKAITEGEKEFVSIAVIGGKYDEDLNEECIPCGYCRQFMSEFVNKDFKIITTKDEYTLEDLLPNSFKL